MVLGTILWWELCSVHKKWWLASQVSETANSTQSWGCNLVRQCEGREGGRKRKQHSPTPKQFLTMTEVRAHLSFKVSFPSVLF